MESRENCGLGSGVAFNFKYLSLLAALFLSLFLPVTTFSQEAQPGYEITLVSVAPPNLRYNEAAFTPWGDLLVSAVSITRVPCDSAILSFDPSGAVSEFADICIEGPMSMAFGPTAGGPLYFSETSGYWDFVYSIPRNGTPTDVRSIASGFITPSDIDFDAAGNLYVSDILTGTISRVAPTGAKTLYLSGFSTDTSGYPDRNGKTIEMAFGPDGLLYVADAYAGKIYRFNADGTSSVLTQSITRPASLAFTSNGDLIVADIVSGVVYSVSPSGAVATIAAGFKTLMSLSVAPDDSVILVEWLNNMLSWTPSRVVRISKSYVPPALDAVVDCKPEILNLRSRGVFVTCYIEPPEGIGVDELASGTAAVTKIDGVALGEPLVSVGPSEVGDYDGDGVADLMVKFSRPALQALLVRGEAELVVRTTLDSGIVMQGADTVRVIAAGNLGAVRLAPRRLGRR